MGVAYASVDDLEDELDGDQSPAHPDRLLARASAVVDIMLRGCVYDVTPAGAPDDPDDADLLKRLTVLQAIYMADDPEGQQAQYSEIRTSTITAIRGQGREAPRFAPRAVEYLQANGWPGQGLVVRR
jgi:hypothetical protein